MKKLAFWLLLCSLFFTACIRESSREEAVNTPVLPVRIYGDGITATDAEGNPAGQEVYNAFDNRIETAWHPAATTIISIPCAAQYVDTLRLYGINDVSICIFSDRKKRNILFTIDNTTTQNSDWIDIPVQSTLNECVLEVTPCGTQPAIAHIELWGHTETTSGVYTHLEGADSNQVEACENLQAVDVYLAESSEAGDSFAVSIPNPWQYRRMYVVFEAQVFRPVNALLKVNECDWLGGLSIPEAAGNSVMRQHSVQVCVQWFVPGKNTLYFKGNGQELSPKNVRVVAVKDTGYNEVLAGTDALVDGMTGSTVTIGAAGAIVTVKQPIRMYGALLYLQGGSVKVHVKDGAGFIEAGSITSSKAGWYYVTCNRAYVTDAVQIVSGDEKQCTVGEVVVCGSPAGEREPEIVISYPRNGEYFGRTAYIEGFVTPYATKEGVATLTIGGRQISTGIGGGFTTAISKDMVGLQHQDDATPWKLECVVQYTAIATQGLQRLYDDSAAAHSTTATLVLDAGYSPYTQSTGNTTTTNDNDTTTDVPQGAGLTVTVQPSSAKSIYYQGVQIEIPKGAVDETVSITIIPLGEKDVAPLTPGMRNVTAPAAGYRFLFNGKAHGSFKKAITISIPYDSSRLLSGTNEQQIQMYYYDDVSGIWKRMEGSRVVTKKEADFALYARSAVSSTGTGGLVVAQSTHFTDFINATLSVPEHPEALLFNPNSIKDIKAGDPVAGMQLIQPPQVSNTGDAGVRFPITIPKGRAGMQPQLELTYSQQGGGGPFGLGWNMRISSISIDTKWGAARYDGTDVYMLDGSQLVPVDNNGNYRTRIEGGFARIVKQGNQWIVTHKNGVQYIYGETDAARLSSGGKIGQWFLEWMIDPNGNCVHYTYAKVTGMLPGSSTPYVQVYLDTIYYTGYNKTNGPFSVQFIREGGRPDVQIDGRMGFIVYTAQRYKEIVVGYNGGTVWRYILQYSTGAFDKSLLAKVEVRAGNGELFYAHDFEYYDEIGWGNEHLNLFEPTIEMEYTANKDETFYKTDTFHFGNIGGSKSTTNQFQFSGNFAPSNPKKMFSVGAEYSISKTETLTKILLMDIDGDGLADQVYSDGGLKYKRNLMGEGISGFAEAKDIRGLPSLGDDENISKTKGAGLNAGMAGARFQKGNSKSETLSYFADVNGDGYVDFIKDKKVYYNYGYNEADGTVEFSTAIPQGTQPVSSEISAPVSPVDEGEEAESKYSFLEYYFRDNPVLTWRAPFNGKVKIEGNVSVQKSVPSSYTTADGIRISVQKTGTQNSTLPKFEEVPRGSSKMMSFDDIEVKSGEYIIFRVDCDRDGAYDEVQWNPVITYKGYVPEAVDENNMYIYSYSLKDDFYVYGTGEFEVPVTGAVRIHGGKICKYEKTSDDITVKITKKRVTQTIDCASNTTIESNTLVLWEYTLPISAQFIGTEFIPDRDDESVENRETRVYGDNHTVKTITMTRTIFECSLQSDTPIDYRKVKWENNDGYMGPLLQYTDVEPGTGDNQLSEATIENITKRIFSLPVITYLFTKPTTYIENTVQNPVNPYVFEGWNVPREGTYRITLTATNTKDTPYMENLVLCVKKRRYGQGYVADVVKKVVNNTETGLHPGESLILQQEMDLDEADALYYIVTSAATEGLQFNLKVEYDLFSNNPWVTGDRMWMEIPGVEYIVYTTIDPSQDISFAGGFRNWYYGRYNADSYMYDQNSPNTYEYEFNLMNTELLKIDIDEAKNNPQKFAEKIAICSAMTPKYKEKVDDQLKEELNRENPLTTNPSYPVWRGMDDDCWIGPGVFATTRVAKKNIDELLHNNDEGVTAESSSLVTNLMQTGNTGAVDMRGVSKVTKTYNVTGNFAGIGSSITVTTSTGYTKRHFFDVNGDRYPDIITDNELIFTGIQGVYVGRTSAIKGPVQKFVSTNYNLSICPQSAATQIETIAKGDGGIKEIRSSFVSVSGSLATGDNNISLDYQDINGDGLPDRISKSLFNGYKVQYNTGYNLSQECNIENLYGIQHTKNKSRSLSVGFSYDKSFLSGGVSVLENASEKMDVPILNEGDRYTLIDINGDGLPDMVAEYDDGLKIYINTGNGFVSYDKKSIGKMEETYGKSWTSSMTLGVKFEILPLVTIGTIIIDGGGSVTKDGNSTQYALRDINGDGLPDIVYQNLEGSKLYVRLNRTGKTNMLKTIKNSIGGKIELDYKRVGNTRAMPQSQWVLSSVTVDDGTTTLDQTPDSEHCYTTQYQYDGGVHDRKNREFLGFAKVTEIKGDGSTVEKEYMVDNYYTKGLMKKQVIKDAEGRVYVEKEYTYGVRTILPATTLWLYEIQYPYLITEKTTYREGGGGTGVVHTQRYAYDDYGNVTMYKDEGSPDTQSDDVIASISYNYNTTSYILDRPLQIAVVDYTGKVYRNRAGSYDSKGNLTRLRIMGGQQGYAVWDFAYDQYGNIVVVKEPANYAGQSYYIQYSYDSTGIYIEKTTDAYGYTATARYNPAFGTPYFTRDINGYSFQYHYDVFGRLKYVWGPYDMASGRAAIEVVYAGAIVTDGRITSPQKTITRNRSGAGYNEVIAVIRFADGIGRELQVKTQAQVEGVYGFICSGAKVYDREGRIIAEGKPYFEEGENFDYTPVSLVYPTTYQYDCMGRKVKTTYPDGGIVLAGYGTRDGKLLECITDQNGNSKVIARDTRGNIVAVTEEGGITTTYQYDVVNQLIAVVDAAGNTTRITYDTWGRRTSIDNPDTGKTSYQYDDAGNLIAKQTANLKAQNKWIRYTYTYKQLKMIDNPNSEDVYFYYGSPGDGHNGAGRVVKEVKGILSDSYWYGALGEVIKKERSIEGNTYRIQWKWDNFGRVRSIWYSNGFSVHYAYDAGGQVKGVVGYTGNYRSEYVKNIEYDQYGSRTKVEYGNSVVTRYSYDATMHRLVKLHTQQGDSTLHNIAYSYDKVGNILTRSEDGVVMSNNVVKSIRHSYSYDNLYRLTAAEGSIEESGNTVNSYRNEFTYSSIGNIMKKLQVVKVKGQDDLSLTYDYSYSYQSNKPHAVTNINDNLTYRYDANGNMTAVYDTAQDYNRVLYWDDDNHLVKTTDTKAGKGVTTTYNYDAKGMRVVKDGPYGKSIYVDTGYVASSNTTETEATLISNHVFVGNTRVASIVKHKEEQTPATYYYASDHLGSSSVLTTQTGSYHERIEYLPYGEVWLEDGSTSSPTGSIGGYTTPYKFTGKELDKETNLYYFGARYYDARISRWVSTDPAIEKYLPSKDKLKVKGEDLKHKGLKDKAYKDYPNMDFEKYKEIEGMGGVYNPINIDMYQYGWQNPITHYDPDGKKVLMLFIGAGGGFGISFEGSAGYLIQYGKGVEFKIYKVMAANKAAGREIMFGVLLTAYPTNINTVEDLKNASFVNFYAKLGSNILGPILGIGIANINNELSISVTGGTGVVGGVSFSIPEEYKKDNEPKELDLNSKEAKFIKNLFKTLFPFEKVK